MDRNPAFQSPWQAMPETAPTVPEAAPPSDGLAVEFVGKRGALFWLALKTGFFTVLTLGFYRFWMKTRLRRWYWSAIRPGGHPMEYVGDPIEKLLGFFIAVVILTFYIGILNLLLMFVSFSVFNSSVIGYVASFAGVIPLWFYARYRARRYVLARTRWRGVRFGLEPGAWGYAWRALLYWALTIVTLGILWPRMTFLLEKYKTDRTFFGSVRLQQGGRWTMLYRSTIPIVVALVFALLLSLWFVVWQPILPERQWDDGLLYMEWLRVMSGQGTVLAWENPNRLWLVLLNLLALVFGVIYYRWSAKRIMANHKTAPGISFSSNLNSARVSMIYVLGNILSYAFLIIGVAALIFLAVAFFEPERLLHELAGVGSMPEIPRWLSFVLFGVLYLGVFLMWGVLHNAFVTFPLMRHMAKTTALPDTSGLGAISQRERDAASQAEGFAEALDLGAAI